MRSSRATSPNANANHSTNSCSVELGDSHRRSWRRSDFEAVSGVATSLRDVFSRLFESRRTPHRGVATLTSLLRFQFLADRFVAEHEFVQTIGDGDFTADGIHP